jgi:DNA mismatch endonuclease Vsr
VPDVLTSKQRSFNMSRIRGKNTSPERIVRTRPRAAKITGYRIHSSLPGRQDIVFPRAKLAVFVDGCFWHRCPKDIPDEMDAFSRSLPEPSSIAIESSSTWYWAHKLLSERHNVVLLNP